MKRFAASLVALVAACGGHSPTPVTVAQDRSELELNAAEDAERKRQHDVARVHYEQAVAVASDPRTAGIAHREFAETLATWGEIESARTHLEAAVVATPKDPIAWQMLGIVRAKQGDTRGAFAALETSKSLAPRAWIPRRDLAVLHWKQGHRAEALSEYKAMLELDLPERLREKVQWAIGVLSQPPGPASPPPS